MAGPGLAPPRRTRWSAIGASARIDVGRTADAAEPTTATIDAPCLKANRAASSLRAQMGARAIRSAGRGAEGTPPHLA